MTFATVLDRYSSEDIERFYSTGQWSPETFFALLETQVALQPDRVFLTDDTSALTFRALRDEALRLAVGLKRLGIGAGDRVSVQIPNWVEFAPIAVALSRIGAVLVPIMTIYRHDEVGYILENAGVSLSITCDTFKGFSYVDMYEDLRRERPDVEHLAIVRGPIAAFAAESTVSYSSLLADIDSSAAGAELGTGVGPDDHFVIIYTSGTTSRPKGCLHTFNTMACGSRLLAKVFGYTAEDVQFGPSPVAHTTGLVTSILMPMMHGAASHIMESWEPTRGLEQISRFGCTLTVTASTFLHMFLGAYDAEVHDATSMRLWVAAGSRIPAALLERASAVLPGLQVLSLYGRTENVTTTSCTITDDPRRSLTSDGSALPQQSVKIVNLEGEELPRGQEGDIAYRGAMHMLEYIKQPEETAAMFTPDGYSRSGDLGHMDEDGYIRVTGRLKDIVIRGGLNISVREVEDLLSAHPAVDSVAVVAMPDERLGERLCCYVVLRPGAQSVTLDDLKAYLGEHRLAIQKMPERLEVLAKMPMTATGKIQKHLLRADIASKVT